MLLVWRADHKQNRRSARTLPDCRPLRGGLRRGGSGLKNKGIPFCNVPDYGTEEAADTACSMLLGLQRNLAIYDVSSPLPR